MATPSLGDEPVAIAASRVAEIVLKAVVRRHWTLRCRNRRRTRLPYCDYRRLVNKATLRSTPSKRSPQCPCHPVFLLSARCSSVPPAVWSRPSPASDSSKDAPEASTTGSGSQASAMGLTRCSSSFAPNRRNTTPSLLPTHQFSHELALATKRALGPTAYSTRWSNRSHVHNCRYPDCGGLY